MTNEREEIQNALYLLKNICTEHACRNCPLSTNGINCRIQAQPPCEYTVNPHTEAIWRAFSDGEMEDED